jgi:hypothetical protein
MCLPMADAQVRPYGGFPVGQASCLSIEDGQDAHPHRGTLIPPEIAFPRIAGFHFSH